MPPAAGTAAQLADALRQYNEDLREWREYCNVHAALKKQVEDSIEPIYLRALEDPNVGFANTTLIQMLTFLFQAYGQITPLQLRENAKRFEEEWDPNTPLELLIHQIETCQEYAEAGNQPFSNAQILNNAYTIVFKTGMYFDDCKEWTRLPAALKTWNAFKLHFLEAQRLNREQQQTTAQAGFHANKLVNEQLAQQTEALANLATATASDRQAFQVLTNAVAELTKQLKEKDAMLEKLLKSSNNNSRAAPGSKKPYVANTPYIENTNYCWTHGYRVHQNHTSASCQSKAEGHQDAATRDNPMGGSTRGKNLA